MYIFHRAQVRDPGAVLVFLARLLGLLLLVSLALSCLTNCSSAKVCKVYYRNDGGPAAGGTVRQWYKAVECPGDPTRVECDDVEPLPTATCR